MSADTTTSDEPVLLVEQLDRVRRVTLNRPAKRNALNADLIAALGAELDAAADDPATHVVVLEGAGRGFCAGFDIGKPSGSKDVWSDRIRLQRSGRLFDLVWNCPLPVIASVHGFCVAGGADLALHCDLLVAADDTRIGYPPVRNLGVPPTNMWLYRIGPQMAKRLLLTGDSITGAEAADIGLAITACPADRVRDVALELATRMARSGRELLIGNKHVVNRGVDLMGRASLASIAATEDAVAHMSPAAIDFRARAAEVGLAEAVKERDAPYQPDPPGLVGGADYGESTTDQGGPRGGGR